MFVLRGVLLVIVSSCADNRFVCGCSQLDSLSPLAHSSPKCGRLIVCIPTMP